jgi:DNA-binding CsgD family transcriptional regulator
MNAAPRSASPKDPRSPALYGREREMAVIDSSLGRALTGDGHLVLVSGEAGIGKTAVVDWATVQARRRGFLVLVGHCYDLSSNPPYGPWSEIVEVYPTSSELPDLPQALSRRTGLVDLANQHDLFTTARGFLLAVAEERPVLIVLEDIHWADQATLDMLRFLARYLQNSRLLIIATYRDTEIAREAYPFKLLPLIARETDAVRISLQPLNSAGVQEIVASKYTLSPSATGRLVEYILEHSEGSPLFIVELLRTLEDDRILVQTDKQWTLDTLDRVRVPHLVQQLIDTRVDRLGVKTRSLLEIASVIGHDVPFGLWERLCAVDDADIEAVVSQSISSGVFREGVDSRYLRFTHSLVREAIYRGIPLPRRQRIHKSIAEMLMEAPSADVDAVAYHLDQAGDRRAIGWLISAGEYAQRSYAWLTAAERFNSAIRAMGRHDIDDERQGWISYRLGRQWRFADPQRGLPFLDRAERYARATGDRILLAFSLADRGVMRIFGGEISRGLKELEAGDCAIQLILDEHLEFDDTSSIAILDTVPSRLPIRADHLDMVSTKINPRRGVLIVRLAMAGRLSEAEALGNQYIQRILAVSEPSDLIRSSYGDALLGFGIIHAARGRPQKARKAFADAREVFIRLNHQALISHSALYELYEVILPYFTTDLDERQLLYDLSEKWREQAVEAIDSPEPDSIAYLLPELLLQGKWERARKVGRDELGAHRGDRTSHARLALAYLGREQGDLNEVMAHILVVLPDGPETVPGDCRFTHAIDLMRIAANLALDENDVNAGKRWIDALDRWLDWAGAVRGRGEWCLLAARYDQSLGRQSAALEHARAALRSASEPKQPLALLAAHRLTGTLLTEERDFDAAEDHSTRSLELADACAAPYERAHSLLSIARLKGATGKIEEAENMLREATDVFEVLGARPSLRHAQALLASLPGRKLKSPYPAGLTRREVDVLRLIAQGMTDREIADKLFISHHTVMRHVSHILAKLNVDSRTSAALAAVRLEIV